jgi:hypothetical protein
VVPSAEVASLCASFFLLADAEMGESFSFYGSPNYTSDVNAAMIVVSLTFFPMLPILIPLILPDEDYAHGIPCGTVSTRSRKSSLI